MYSKEIMDRFVNPENACGLRGANGVGKVTNDLTSDMMKMYLQIDEDGRIEEARFKTFGCCVAIASSDLACDLIKGKTIEEALQVTNQDMLAVLGEMPAYKEHYTVMAESLIHSAIEDYYKRKEKESRRIAQE